MGKEKVKMCDIIGHKYEMHEIFSLKAIWTELWDTWCVNLSKKSQSGCEFLCIEIIRIEKNYKSTKTNQHKLYLT